jgi:branched-chain amino acid transport system substrate-binding protein
MPLQRRTLIGAASGLTILSRRPRADIAADAVKVGVLGDQTTFGADAGGVGSVIAARMAAEDFGGRAGGRPVEVVAADFGDRPDVAATTARRWFDREGVHVIADMTLSSAALAVQGIARERGRTLLIAGAATSDLTGKACSPFSTHWADDTHVIATNVARGLLETGQDTWFFISPDYALGTALERDATAAITAGGGRVVGRASHPVQETDFSSLLLRAQASRAKVVGLTSVGTNTVNQVKQAREFGIVARGQKLAGFLIFITDIHSIGLDAAQGLNVVDGFYWDQNERSRAFARRFAERHNGRMPTKQQAGTYASVLHYLKAVDGAGSVDGAAVNARMREMPVDYLGREGRIRPDGRVLYDVTLYEVKSPGESRMAWDYYKPVRTLPKETAFRPPGADGCRLGAPS